MTLITILTDDFVNGVATEQTFDTEALELRHPGHQDQSVHGNWAHGGGGPQVSSDVVVETGPPRKRPSEGDYQGMHTPNPDGDRVHALGELVAPTDVLDHPEWYTAYPRSQLQETVTQLKAVEGDPDATVTIFRSAPSGADVGIYDGDWVTLSEGYARVHAESGHSGEQATIYARQVPAREVRWATDDLMEFGWFPDRGHLEPADVEEAWRSAEFRHPGHPDQSVHGKWAHGSATDTGEGKTWMISSVIGGPDPRINLAYVPLDSQHSTITSDAGIKWAGAKAVVDQMSPEEVEALEVELRGINTGYKQGAMFAPGSPDAYVNDSRTLAHDELRTMNQIGVAVTGDMDFGTVLQCRQAARMIKPPMGVSGEQILSHQATARISDAIGEFNMKTRDAKALSKVLDEEGISVASAFVSDVNRSWAASSQYPMAQAVQIQVARSNRYRVDSNGIPISMRWNGTSETLGRQFSETFGSSIKAYTNGVSTHTQNVIDAGVREGAIASGSVKLYRGVGEDAVRDGGLSQGGPITINTNPLSSWSTNPVSATEFGSTRIVAEVPLREVFSISTATGLGCAGEAEIVVANGESMDGIADVYERAGGGDGVVINLDEYDADWIKVVAEKHGIDVEFRHPGHSPQSVHAGKNRNQIKGLTEPDGGFTTTSTGTPIQTGWSVAIEGTSKFMSAEEFTSDPAAAQAFIKDFARGVGPGENMGGWHDPNPDTPGQAIVLDKVRVFPSDQHDAARAFAVKNNQKSMANLDAITAGDWDNAIEDTGGTGDSLSDHGQGVARRSGADQARLGDDRGGAGRVRSGYVRRDGVGARAAHAERLIFGEFESYYLRHFGELSIRHAKHNQKDHAGKGKLAKFKASLEGTTRIDAVFAELTIQSKGKKVTAKRLAKQLKKMHSGKSGQVKLSMELDGTMAKGLAAAFRSEQMGDDHEARVGDTEAGGGDDRRGLGGPRRVDPGRREGGGRGDDFRGGLTLAAHAELRHPGHPDDADATT